MWKNFGFNGGCMNAIKSGLTTEDSEVIRCRFLVINAIPDPRWFCLGYVFYGLTKRETGTEKAIYAFADTKRDFLIKTNQQPFITHFWAPKEWTKSIH